jgi:hypothetical protein
MKVLILIATILLTFGLSAQTGVIKGTVTNRINNEALAFVNVYIPEIESGIATDLDGNFEIKDLEPGTYSVVITFVGFEDYKQDEIVVSTARPAVLDIKMIEISTVTGVVEVKASAFTVADESPVSMKTLSAGEIERYPGANRDVSRVIQALPGVAATPSFRNDIIIRGGAPSENKFYLDGIEVPNINHFATQGSSGGPVGLLNINFIREVDFRSGSFPASRANGLSSVMEFKQKTGNPDFYTGSFQLGSSDIGFTFDGPLGKKANMILSVRRSYLDLLFSLLKLPFLPTYNDAQFKIQYDIDRKNRLTFIGLGAIDNFKLNTKVNDKVDDPEDLERNEYILGNLPSQQQWNYTIGAKYVHFFEKSYLTVVLSRNMLNNNSTKYRDNDDSDPLNLILDYNSQESENKLRIENTWDLNGWKVNVGGGYELARYTNSTKNLITIDTTPVFVNYDAKLLVNKFSAFAQVSKGFFKKRFDVTLGLRTDFNTYNSDMLNPLNQLSPILGLKFRIDEDWSINASVARYSQLPAYTMMGFQDDAANLVNRDNLKYIKSNHFIFGFEFQSKWDARFTLEGFYKMYEDYPFSLVDSISLANLGADFGVIGNEPVASINLGRSYGLEFMYQQKMLKGFYGILAYTFVKSEFQDKNGAYVPSSWDSRHIVSLSFGKQFKKGWVIGFRWQFSDGLPYTPYDVPTSANKNVWDINQQGVLNYNELNTQRLKPFHQLDIRVDKKFYFTNWSLNLYLDIQNVYGHKVDGQPFIVADKDANGVPITDPNDPSKYQLKELPNVSGTILPTIGVIIDFSFKKKTPEQKAAIQKKKEDKKKSKKNNK